MDPSSSSLVTQADSRMLDLCDDGHTFKFSHDQLPKHKIFISHSGKQKDFAEQLCEDLEQRGYHPFFDKRPHSLPKGEIFPDLIFEATRECFLAIVLLSEEFFTRSKWPMLELASLMEAKKTREHLRILPVYLNDLSPDDLKDTARWSEVWETWVKQGNRLECNVVSEWERAVKFLKSVNALLQRSYEGEVALRKAIVEAVTMRMPPDIHSDVAHVQGKEHIKKEIISKFKEIPPSCSRLCQNAKVLGVYGIVGEGKSTLCMILTNALRSAFQGRVCHVELNERDSTVKLQHQALKQLTEVNNDYLNQHIHTAREGLACLKKFIHKQKVFLALDNVSDWSVEAAKMFLEPEFCSGSMVLVTAHSRDVLYRMMGIPEDCCVPCPQITEQEAMQIMLDCINLSTEKLTAEQRDALQKALDLCNFGKFRGFHPLCLKLLASQMGSDPSSWGPGDLHECSDKNHVLFSALETNFARLPNRLTQDIFMDVALFCPESVINVHDICMWLSDTLHPNCSIADINRKLDNLRLKSLMEVWKTDTDVIRIHDLHRELAKSKAKVEEVSSGTPSRFVYQKGANNFSAVLSNRQLAVHIERASFVECTFTKASFEECSQLQLLCIRNCTQLAALSLHGLHCLVSLELSCCCLKGLKLEGLVNLRWLCVNSCAELKELSASGLDKLMHVLVSRCINLEVLQLEKCNMLKSVCVEYNCNLMDVHLGSGRSLHCLTLWFCERLGCVHLSESMILSEFKKRGCPQLSDMQGFSNVSDDVKCLILNQWHKIPRGVVTSLAKSTHLCVLDLWDCVVSRLPDLGGCQNLYELRLSRLDVVLDSSDSSLLKEYTAILHASSKSLQLPVALQELRIESCRNVVVKEVCWKVRGLQNLRILSMQRVSVTWDWQLRYMPIEQKGSNASNQGFDSMNHVSVVERPNEVLHTDMEISRDSVESSNKGERKGFEILNCLSQIMHWVEEYLKNTADDSYLEREIYVIVKHHREKNMAKSLSTAASENAGLHLTMMYDHIPKSQYGIIERMLLETCNSCDTACEQVLQRLIEEGCEPSNLQRVDTLIEVFQKVGAQELEEQLLMLRAIMKEVNSFEETNDLKGWEHRLAGQEISSALRLENRLSKLTKCRCWYFGTNGKQQNSKWGLGWLRSCKVDILIEQLLVLVEKGEAKGVVDEDRGDSSHFQWLREMAEEVELLMRNELDKKWSEASGQHYEELDEFRSLLRGWKSCRWLQALASCLLRVSVQESQAVTDKRVWTTNQKLQEFFEAANVRLLHLHGGFISAGIWLFSRGLKDMVAILEALALEMQEKQEMLELLHPTVDLIWERRERLEIEAAVLQEQSLHLQLLLPRGGESSWLWSAVENYMENMFIGFKADGDEFLQDLLNLSHTPVEEVMAIKERGWRKAHSSCLGFLHVPFHRSKLSRTPAEEVTAKERVSVLDMSKNFADCLEVLSSSMGFLRFHFCLQAKIVARTGLGPSEDLAEMLREQLALMQHTQKFGGESQGVVPMWMMSMSTLRLIETLPEFLKFLVHIHETFLSCRTKQEAEVKSKMVDAWERLSGMPYQQHREYIMKVEQEVRQLCASANDFMPMINEQERSALLKLIQHFHIIGDVDWEGLASSRFGHPLDVDEAAPVEQIIMERFGRMSTLMMRPYKPLTKTSKWGGLHMNWRRAENFPLQQQWIDINGDSYFILPVANCLAIRHFSISDCGVKIPINLVVLEALDTLMVRLNNE